MLKIFPNIEELNRFAAEKFVEIANEAIEKRGQFTIALAGGSTPKSLYQLLSGEIFKNKVDWSRCFFYFGDERNVSPDDAESNFRMAHENLFEPLGIHVNNIFPWMTGYESPEITAQIYAAEIKRVFGLRENEFPRFDLILLGMGADGHTASLFPFTGALRETEKTAAANPVEKLRTIRLTLTFPVINNARNVIFLVAGEEKATTLREVLEGEFQPEKFPSQNVKPARGELFWLLDKNVAKLLKTDGN
jgi:6-phosphogluconolactonase